MQIIQVIIKNFRCIKEAKFYPDKNSVLLGPNNSGKTAILEALNLLLNPEISYRNHSIDENDFYKRNYWIPPITVASSIQPTTAATSDSNNLGIPIENAESTETSNSNISEILTEQSTRSNEVSSTTEQTTASIQVQPKIYIEVIIIKLSTEDEDVFSDFLVPWDAEKKEVLERSDEDRDPFEGKEKAIRVFFEAWYSEEEDDFLFITKFLREVSIPHDECEDFTRNHKRQIGFLIYRDFRGLTRPITLETATLFGRLLQSQNVIPKNFEKVFSELSNILYPIVNEPDFISLLNSYKSELELFMPLSQQESSALSFDLTDRTRSVIKEITQLYSKDDIYLPMQKSGAGTRSLAILAMLTLIMRRRGRGILALEEPETFLFPHAQRRVIDECLELSDQLFVTTHSPFVLERIPVEGVGRVHRDLNGLVSWQPIRTENVKKINLYSRRLKEVHCEALMGKGVLVVEGNSDRWWLLGASRVLNKKTFDNFRLESFELQGISVVSADTNGDILKLCEFFKEAGIVAIGLFDQINDTGLLDNIYTSELPCIFLWGDGIEKILSEELPLDVLKKLLTEAPHSTQQLLSTISVNAMNENNIRYEAFNKLKNEKGSASMHDWLINLLDDTTIPLTLKRIVYLVNSHISNLLMLNMRSICKG